MKKLLALVLLASYYSATLSALGGVKKYQPTIQTVPQAITYAQNAYSRFSAHKTAMVDYEKEQSDGLVKAAKVLYDAARMQLLDALSEIDSRINYWQYQKDHPWQYFVGKNPLKWVVGPKQNDEIEANFDLLHSHQGELYVLLGQLGECGTEFNRGYKDTFLIDYEKGYEWIDKVLNTLVRITTRKAVVSNHPFAARAYDLQLKLEKVLGLKDDILAEIAETKIPSYLERTWFKSGALLLGLGYAYNKITPEHIQSTWSNAQQGFGTVIDPVASTIKDVLIPGWRHDTNQESKHVTKNNQRSPLDEAYAQNIVFAKKLVLEAGDDYDLQEQAKNVVKALDKNDLGPLEVFLKEVSAISPQIALSKPVKSINDLIGNFKEYLQGQLYLNKMQSIELIRGVTTYALEQQEKYEKQYAAVGKVVLLIPAVIVGGLMYAGYQKLTAKNYSSLRQSLVDINGLFIEPSKQLNDEQYGKMIYLVYMLKRRAQKEVPTKKNLRADFIRDLEKIESQEFSVAAKRAIVEDMFKKYSFLGLIQKK